MKNFNWQWIFIWAKKGSGVSNKRKKVIKCHQSSHQSEFKVRSYIWCWQDSCTGPFICQMKKKGEWEPWSQHFREAELRILCRRALGTTLRYAAEQLPSQGIRRHCPRYDKRLQTDSLPQQSGASAHDTVCYPVGQYWSWVPTTITDFSLRKRCLKISFLLIHWTLKFSPFFQWNILLRLLQYLTCCCCSCNKHCCMRRAQQQSFTTYLWMQFIFSITS